jgi:hypothetical protein
VAKLAIGAGVGNPIFTFALCAVMMIGGCIFLKRTGSSSWNRPLSIFARCHVAMVFYVSTSLLFAPTMEYGLVALVLTQNSPILVSERVLVAIFVLVFYLLPVSFYVVWGLFIRERKEGYRLFHHHRKEKTTNAQKSSLKQQITSWIDFWLEGPGEWRMPLAQTTRGKLLTENDRLGFDAATPLLDGYQGHCFWFAAAEFGTQLLIALAAFIAELVPSEKSCVAQATILLTTFSIFFLLCVYFRPFQERLNRWATPISTAIEIVILSIAVYFGKDQPDWLLSVVVLSVSMQSAMTVIVLLASIGPLFKQVLKVFARFKNERKRSDRNGKGTESQTKTSLFDLFSTTEATGLKNLLLNDNKDGKDIELKTSRKTSGGEKTQTSPKKSNPTRSSSTAAVSSSSLKSKRSLAEGSPRNSSSSSSVSVIKGRESIVNQKHNNNQSSSSSSRRRTTSSRVKYEEI